MTLLTDEELFGTFIPKPTVNKITLQSSGVPPRRLNPHIDPPTELATRTAGIVEGTENSPAPVMQGTSANLKIVLNLSVKDKIKDLQNSWFANVSPMITDIPNYGLDQNFDLKDYVKIFVFQSTDQNMSQTILGSADPINDIKSWLRSGVGEVKEKQLSDIDNPDDVPVGGPSNSKYLDVPYCVTFENEKKYPNYLCYFVWAELDLSELANEFNFGVAGFSVNDLFEDIEFNSQLSHYIALSAGKVPSTVTSYFIDDPAADEDNGMRWTGKVQQVADGRWQTWSRPRWFLKKTTEKNILVQDFRFVDRLNKLNLDFSIVQNAIKGDLSLASKMRTANLSLDPFQQYFTDIMLTRDVEDNCRFLFSLNLAAIMAANSPYGNLFTNPLTKNRCITQTKILSLSLHRVRLKGSPETGSKPIFGPKIFGSRQAKRFNENNEFLSSFRFVGVDEFGQPYNNVLPSIYTTENDELLLKASYGEDGVLSSYPFDGAGNIAGSMIEDLTGTIYEGDFNSKVGVKYFGGIDNTVKFKTDGYYQYRMVFEIEDGAVQYLIQSLIDLRIAKMNLSEYYTEASKLGTSQLKNPFADPHIVPPLQPEYPIEPGGVRPGNFNVAANRFTQEFQEFATNKVDTGRVDEVTQAKIFTPPWHDSLNNPPWESVAATYINAMRNLSGVEVRYDWQDQIQLTEDSPEFIAIKNYMSPETGNIEGILKVFSLIESLENIISRAIGRTTSPPDGLLYKKRSRDQNPKILLSGKAVAPMPTKKNTTLKSIKIDHTFKNIFNANLPKDTGINIFNYETLPTTSLRKISYDWWKDDKFYELQKFFGRLQTGVKLDIPYFSERGGFPISETSSRYFTPSMIKTPTTSINLTPGDNVAPGGESEWPPLHKWGRVGIADDMNSFQTAIAGVQLSAQVASFMAYNYNLMALSVDNYDFVIDPKPATAFDMAIGPGDEPPPTTTPDDLFRGKNYNFNARKNETDLLNRRSYDVFSSISQILNEGGKKDMTLYGDGLRSYLQKIKPTREEFGALPNPVKILFAYGNDFVPGETSILAKSIQQLLADNGFNGGGAVKMAMRYLFETIYVMEIFVGWQQGRMVEMWEPASSELISAPGNTRAFLCRFRRYENPEYGITANNSSKLPLYEQYFLLEPGSAT